MINNSRNTLGAPRRFARQCRCIGAGLFFSAAPTSAFIRTAAPLGPILLTPKRFSVRSALPTSSRKVKPAVISVRVKLDAGARMMGVRGQFAACSKLTDGAVLSTLRTAGRDAPG